MEEVSVMFPVHYVTSVIVPVYTRETLGLTEIEIAETQDGEMFVMLGAQVSPN